MTKQQSSQKRLIRLGQILKIFMEKEKVSSIRLSERFQTTPRTIQRDLLLLKEAGFPLRESHKGIYEMSKDLMKNLEVFDDTELSLVVALKNIVGQLGKPFSKAADGVFDRLYDSISPMPIFVKIDEAVPIESRMMSKVVKAIRDKKLVSFHYDLNLPHSAVVEPYRIVYYGGFWYLVGKEPDNNTLKRYALDRIRDLQIMKARFKAIPDLLFSVCG